MTSKQKKIRDIERLLRRINTNSTPLLQPSSIDETCKTIGNGDGDVSATVVKVGREEFRKTSKLKQKMDELENLKKLREESLRKVRERKNSVKYHMVRFLERKRVTRMICSIDSKITKFETTSSEEPSSKERKKTLKLLQLQRSSLEKDLIYIMYYPMEYKYISLFAKAGEETKNESSDSEAKDGSNERIYSAQRNSALSQKVRQLAEEAYRADLAASEGDPDGNSDGDESVSASRPSRDRVQHALDVAKKRRQQRQTQKLRLVDGLDAEKPPHGGAGATGEKEKKKTKRKASPPEEEGLIEDATNTEDTVHVHVREGVHTNPSEKPPSTLTSPRKKSKSESESKTAKTSKPSQPTQRAPNPVPSPVPIPAPEPTGDAFFMEESSEQDRAAADEESQRRRQEHDRLRIGDIKALRKKTYKHRSLFKKR